VSNEFTLSSYGPGVVEFVPRGSYPPIGFIQSVLMSKARINELDGLNYFTQQGEPNISYKFEHCNDGFGYFFFDNQSRGTTLIASVLIESMKGCELSKWNLTFSQ
jgi:hypothetical protein